VGCNFVTKELWNMPHRALIWIWAIFAHFQRRRKILAATNLTVIATGKNFLTRRPIREDVRCYKEGDWKARGAMCELWWHPRGRAVDWRWIKSGLFLLGMKTKNFKMCEFKLDIWWTVCWGLVHLNVRYFIMQ